MTIKYKGREYTIEPTLAGTSNHGGDVFYQGVYLSHWWSAGSAASTIEEALQRAHDRLTAIEQA